MDIHVQDEHFPNFTYKQEIVQIIEHFHSITGNYFPTWYLKQAFSICQCIVLLVTHSIVGYDNLLCILLFLAIWIQVSSVAAYSNLIFHGKHLNFMKHKEVHFLRSAGPLSPFIPL